jgi:hypothetical protein
MHRPQLCDYSRKLAVFSCLFILLRLLLGVGQVSAQQPPPSPEHAGHHHMDMPMEQAADPAVQARLQAKIMADKEESEFNHHLAGVLVAIAGVFMLFQSRVTQRWPFLKFVWPACFLLAGLFVLIWSDTELWPFGHRQWLEALENNREVLQHKTFAVLLLGLGAVEWQRARGALKAAWSGWIFPLIAIAGSVILIFHEHEGGMAGEHHMETMARIQSEHMSYTISGLAIGLSKGLSELKAGPTQIFAKLWPSLMILLGVLLIFYRE